MEEVPVTYQTSSKEAVHPHGRKPGHLLKTVGLAQRYRTAPPLFGSLPGFAPAHPPATLACQRFVNERARKDQDRLVPVRKWSYRWPAQIASGRSSQDQSGRPATHLKTVVRKDLGVRVPRPPQTGSYQGFCFNRVEIFGAACDAVEGSKIVARDPDLPYLVGARRRLIRTFADSR
jgi:hypothetical protein